MNSVLNQEQPSSTSPHHPRRKHYVQYHNKLVDLGVKVFSNPIAYSILLVLTFVLGYLAHSQPLLSLASQDVIWHNTFSRKSCAAPVSSTNVRQTIIDRVFNAQARKKSWLRHWSPWKEFHPEQAKPLLQEWNKGWGSENPVFEHLITQVQPKTIIEVGTFLGASATHMAGLTKKMGLDTQIICIDAFRGWPGYNDHDKSLKMLNGDSMLLYQFMHNVVKANASDSIMFLPFSTTTALRGMCHWGVYGDLIEIDAAHDFHSAWVDINMAYKLLRKPGGVMFGHDYAWEGVRNAVHSFARINGFELG